MRFAPEKCKLEPPRGGRGVKLVRRAGNSLPEAQAKGSPLASGVDPLDAAWGNTCVTVIDGPPWRVTLLACTAHIDGSEVEPGRRPPGI